MLKRSFGALQVRIRLAVFSFFILSIVLLYFVKYKSCRVFSDTWLGLTPLHVRPAPCQHLRHDS